MDGNAAASGHEAHDLVSRNRVAAFGEAHCQVVDPLDHDAALALSAHGHHSRPVVVSNGVQDRRVGHFPLQLFLPLLHHLIDDLALF